MQAGTRFGQVRSRPPQRGKRHFDHFLMSATANVRHGRSGARSRSHLVRVNQQRLAVRPLRKVGSPVRTPLAFPLKPRQYHRHGRLTQRCTGLFAPPVRGNRTCNSSLRQKAGELDCVRLDVLKGDYIGRYPRTRSQSCCEIRFLKVTACSPLDVLGPEVHFWEMTHIGQGRADGVVASRARHSVTASVATEPLRIERPPQSSSDVLAPPCACRRLRLGVRRFRRGRAVWLPSARGSSVRAWLAKRARQCS